MEVSVILLLILFSMPPLIRPKSRSRGEQLVNGPPLTIPVSGRPKRSVKEVDYSNGGVRSTNSSPAKVNVLTTCVRVCPLPSLASSCAPRIFGRVPSVWPMAGLGLFNQKSVQALAPRDQLQLLIPPGKLFYAKWFRAS